MPGFHKADRMLEHARPHQRQRIPAKRIGGRAPIVSVHSAHEQSVQWTHEPRTHWKCRRHESVPEQAKSYTADSRPGIGGRNQNQSPHPRPIACRKNHRSRPAVGAPHQIARPDTYCVNKACQPLGRRGQPGIQRRTTFREPGSRKIRREYLVFLCESRDHPPPTERVAQQTVH